jgi:hypothetical protein
MADGRVVTWGHPDYGGDSSAVQDILTSVQHVQATERAFAAILADGSVVNWGNRDYGGNSSAVKDQLANVQQVQATERAFAEKSWRMDRWLLGAIQIMVVTTLKFSS